MDSARLSDLPQDPVQLAVAVSGPQSVSRFAPLADHLVTTEPEAELLERWGRVRADAGLGPSRTIGRIPVCWDRDTEAAVQRAHETFRWFGDAQDAFLAEAAEPLLAKLRAAAP